ncbi:LysE family translocator [Rhizobium sp. L1K21]|uniref:LysE family translocator n=1 Tax=Rhizobium sp. L1K21 TaxID=2954933 RepID=UPI002091EA66|nr:LysE family translocator [Rhizobium sp. L1K21]MCO6186707.1 LysE family translocator [Rhizobium sp. L1K21]
MDITSLLSSNIAAFALASLLIELTPGPNMSWLAMLAASEGRLAGLKAVAGIGLGLALGGAVAAFGVGELIQASDLAYEVLRWAGIGFLLYLAYDGWREPTGDGVGQSARNFWRGLMANLLNPKAYIFYISVLPAFIDPKGDPMHQTWVLTAVYVAIATGVHLALVIATGTLQPVLSVPSRARIVRRVMSVLLAGVALWFAISTAR